MAASHVTFVAAAYGFAAFVLLALLFWVALDYRVQRKRVAELEARRAKKN